jgi:hypothetical protein
VKNNISVNTLYSVISKEFHLKESRLSSVEKSTLIRNLLSGIISPFIVAVEMGEKLSVIYGEDLVTAIKEYSSGVFGLEPEGEKFSQLGDDAKADFLETQIAMCVYRSLKSEQIDDLAMKIKAVNGLLCGVMNEQYQPLIEVVTETNVSIENSECIGITLVDMDTEIDSLLGHPFFTKVNVQQLSTDIILAIMMVDSVAITTDLSAKSISEYKEKLTEMPSLKPILDYLDKAFDSKEVFLKKLHLPMVAFCAKYAISKGVSTEKFKEVISNFFIAYPPAYKKASDSGTATRSNVNNRTRIMYEYITETL